MNTHPSKCSFHAILKWLAILPLLAAYLAAAALLSAYRDRVRRRKLLLLNSKFFSGLALALLGVKVHVKQRGRLSAGGGRLLVANHVSYTDVLILASLVPSAFVTSVELKQTALLGTLARSGGSLYVERRTAAGLKQEIAEIAHLLRRGFTVVLFPEGTTTDGERVYPFKKSLFDAAVVSGADVLPVCLRYRAVDGEPLSTVNRESVFYYGGTSFGRHFPRLLSRKSIEVDVIPLPLIKAGGTLSRKELAAAAHERISRAYSEPPV